MQQKTAVLIVGAVISLLTTPADAQTVTAAPRLLFDVACFGDDCAGVNDLLVLGAKSLTSEARQVSVTSAGLLAPCGGRETDINVVGTCIDDVVAQNRDFLSSVVRDSGSDGFVVLYGRRIDPYTIWGILILAGREKTTITSFTVQHPGHSEGDWYVLSGGFNFGTEYAGIPGLPPMHWVHSSDSNARHVVNGVSRFQ